MLGVASVVYGPVVVFMFAAARVPRQTATGRAARWIGASALVTIGVSSAFLVSYIRVGNALDRHPSRPLVIEVIGHQWWWEVLYRTGDSPNPVATANEIHIPVGQQVAVELRSSDVIHSFWVPSLGGKRDLIPGHPTRAWIEADSAGVYRGQCSQFCGLQHAHMAMFVVAQSPTEFEAWLQDQQRAGVSPSDSIRTRGRQVFLAARCWTCHTIQGTIDVGVFAPNLTHVGSRSTIAAGTLTNTREHLAAWILNPQSFKPGAVMPSNPIGAADLLALTTYLKSLQ